MNNIQTNIRRRMSLGDYVKYRNGVPLGASGSLQNMLVRSLGAGTFAKFWQNWNPIWGYALGRYIYQPLSRFIPAALALILTFTISGAIHDLATTLFRGTPAFFFTPWFSLMSVVVVFGRLLKLDYSSRPFLIRVAINCSLVAICAMLTMSLHHYL